MSKSLSKNSDKLFSVLLPGIFIFVGVCFTIISICIKMNSDRKENVCTEKTTAEVVDIIRKVSHDVDEGDSVTFAPVFTYKTSKGEVTVESNVSSNPCDYYKGQKVELYINPEKPTEYYIPGDKTINLITAIFAGIGIILTIVGAVIAVFIRKCNKAKSVQQNGDFISEQIAEENNQF